jgi:hypothetical protein
MSWLLDSDNDAEPDGGFGLDDDVLGFGDGGGGADHNGGFTEAPSHLAHQRAEEAEDADDDLPGGGKQVAAGKKAAGKQNRQKKTTDNAETNAKNRMTHAGAFRALHRF